MSQKVYIVDYLGSHASGNPYVRNLKMILSTIDGVEVEILSNYADGEGEPFFLNQYAGRIWHKGYALYKNYGRLSSRIEKEPEAVYIFQAYGNSIDVSFMRIAATARRHVMDVRVPLEQLVEANEMLVADFATVYSQRVSAVISHSSATDALLSEFGFDGEVLHLRLFENREISLAEELAGTDIPQFLSQFEHWLRHV